METHRSFASKEAELEFYKKLCAEYKQKAREAQLELEEFQETSREVESELETQLEQLEVQNKDLRTTKCRLERELDSTQDKLEILQSESIRHITELEDELNKEKKGREDLTKYVRELEQANDDLERAKRATLCSLEDFELRLNMAIERNAFLENELDEKEALVFSVQRLKDEARDLKQELSVHTTVTKPPGGGSSYHRMPNNDNKCEKLRELSQDLDSSQPLPFNGSPTAPLTPSARISALNIVGDLLRRVGALESKLASCRNFVKEPPSKSEKEGSSSPISPVKTPTEKKRSHRGSSLPIPKERLKMGFV